MALSPLRPQDPTRVGRHRLLARLGQGGMGTVYLGVDPSSQAVAVKVLRDGPADVQARPRLRREVSALRQVRGPHLVEVLDADVDAELPYLVTRFVPGERLDDVVGRHGPLAGADLRRLARGLADALSTLHGAGIIHRDLTPANVLLLDGQPQVIDLGMALALDVTAITRTGLLIGTAGYLAPEQVLGEVATAAVDVHAWGATVAFAATGRPPYGVGRPEAVLYRIVHEGPDLAGVPAELAALVAAAMQPDPAARPDSLRLLARLGGTAASEPVPVQLPAVVDATTLLALVSGAPTDVLVTELLATDVQAVVARQPDAAATVALGYGAAPATRTLPRPGSGREAVDFWDAGLDGGDAPGAEHVEQEPAERQGRRDERPGWRDERQALERQSWQDEQRGWRDEPPWPPERADELLPWDNEADLPPRERPARVLQRLLTAAAGLAALAGLALVVPVVAALLALALLVGLRAAGRCSAGAQSRLQRRGQRRRDPIVTAAALPWHLLCAAAGTALSLPLLALAVALPAGAVWLTRPSVVGVERAELVAAIAVPLALLIGLARRVHRPSRRLLRTALISATPGPGSAGVVLALLALASVLLLAAARGQAAIWWPLASPVGGG